MREKDHCIINTVVKLCNLQRMTRLLSPAVSNGITSSPQSQCRYILQWKAPGLAVLDDSYLCSTVLLSKKGPQWYSTKSCLAIQDR